MQDFMQEHPDDARPSPAAMEEFLREIAPRRQSDRIEALLHHLLALAYGVRPVTSPACHPPLPEACAHPAGHPPVPYARTPRGQSFFTGVAGQLRALAAGKVGDHIEVAPQSEGSIRASAQRAGIRVSTKTLPSKRRRITLEERI